MCHVPITAVHNVAVRRLVPVTQAALLLSAVQILSVSV